MVAGVVFYILQPKKPISPISSKQIENNNITTSEKQPSKTLKDYTDSAGFSFKYPEDVKVKTLDTSDSATYSSLDITSLEVKGSMSLKVLDTKLGSIDEWFLENKLAASTKKEIKIGEILGKEINANNKIIAAGLDQGILFTIEVDPQNQKYWTNVYNTMLSSFNFVPAQSQVKSSAPDTSSSDVTLEEDTVQ